MDKGRATKKNKGRWYFSYSARSIYILTVAEETFREGHQDYRPSSSLEQQAYGLAFLFGESVVAAIFTLKRT